MVAILWFRGDEPNWLMAGRRIFSGLGYVMMILKSIYELHPSAYIERWHQGRAKMIKVEILGS